MLVRFPLLTFLLLALCAALCAGENKPKLMAAFGGYNGTDYARWLLGPFNSDYELIALDPNVPIAPDTALVVYARWHERPQLRFEGIRLSRDKLAPGEKFEVTYYFRRLSADPIASDLRCAVHFRLGAEILINADHNFKTPLPDWKPGELYADGPYRLQVPDGKKKGELSLRILLDADFSADSRGEVQGGKRWGGPNLHVADIPLSEEYAGQPGELVTLPADLAQSAVPYPAVLEKLRTYAAAGGTVLLAGPPAAQLQDLLPAINVSDAGQCARLAPSGDWRDFPTQLPQPYLSTQTAAEATVALKFANGAPALLSRPCGRGTIYFWAGGLGRDYQAPPLPVYFDEFLVRLAANATGRPTVDLATRAAQAAAQATPAPDSGLATGVSEHNFGRFGWQNSDGLLTGEFTETGKFIHKLREYGFFTEPQEKSVINLCGEWELLVDRQAAFKAGQLPEQGWGSISVPGEWEKTIGGYDGVGWYRKTFDMPTELVGKQLELNFGAIDDFDQTYFNGAPVGATDARTEFWWSEPRNYLISADRVKPGRNTILVRVEDVKGGGGIVKSPAELRLSGTRDAAQLTVTGINWLSKKLTRQNQGHTATFINSLALPGVTLQTDSTHLTIAGLQPRFAVLPLTAGQPVRECAAGTAIFERQADGQLARGVLCGWFGDSPDKTDTPFIVVLQHEPTTIKATAAGLAFDFPQACGRVALIFPYGEKEFAPGTTALWAQNPPAELEDLADFWWRHALKLPVNCRESFRIDHASGKALIFDRFEYDEVEDDWHTPRADWAAIPPLVAFERSLHLPHAAAIAGAASTGCLGTLGPQEIVDGSAEVDFALPLPPADHFGIVARQGQTVLAELAQEHFVLPGKWAWRYAKHTPTGWAVSGGQTQNEHYKRPGAADYLDLSRFRRHLSGILSLYLLGPAGREMASETFNTYHQAFNFHQSETIQDWRVEPFSKLEYPVNTIFARGQECYNDVNEFCSAQQYLDWCAAAYSGDWASAAANWSFMRLQARFLSAMHDWGYMASGCREHGAGAFIDMLAAELPGSIAHARLAEALGDRATADRMWYMAARQAVPTRARMWFKNYARQTGRLNAKLDAADQTITGFRENGPDVRPISARHMPPYLYDTAAYGVAAETVLLHKTYTLKEMEAFEQAVDQYAPDWKQLDVIAGPWSRLEVRAFLAPYQAAGLLADLRAADKALEPLWREGRWGNYAITPALIAARDGNFFLADWRGVTIIRAEENETRLELNLSVPAEMVVKPLLNVFCRRKVAAVRANGMAMADWRQAESGQLEIAVDRLAVGTHDLQIEAAGERIFRHVYYP